MNLLCEDSVLDYRELYRREYWLANKLIVALFPVQIGRILERDSKNYKATIELVHSSKILTVDYDDICEYTGDVED